MLQSIVLADDWLDKVLARIELKDEVERITKQRQQATDQLRRLGRAYVDGLYSDNDYQRHKRSLEMELESLVLPQADTSAEAGRLRGPANKRPPGLT